MNIKGLQGYTRIMATGTLSAAAKSMHISESALSRQLSLLETELGLVLFSREKRRLIPTEEGEAFFREAERLLDAIEQIPEIVSEIKNGTRRRMRIITMPRMAVSIMGPAISSFLKEQPGTEITVEVQPRRFLERWVASRKFDLGLGALPTAHSGIQTERIYRVPVVAVLHPDHVLASRHSLQVKELSDERFILMPLNTLLGQQVARLLDKDGIVPKTIIQASQANLSCSFVAEGLGITITDAMIPVTFGAAVKMIPLEPRVYMDFGLIFPIGVKPTRDILRLIEIIKSQASLFIDNLNF